MKFKDLRLKTAYKIGRSDYGIRRGYVLDTERRYSAYGSSRYGTNIAMLTRPVYAGDRHEHADDEEAMAYTIAMHNEGKHAPNGWYVSYVTPAQIVMAWDEWVPVKAEQDKAEAEAEARRKASIADMHRRARDIKARASRLGLEEGTALNGAYSMSQARFTNTMSISMTEEQFNRVLGLLEQLQAVEDAR